MKYRLGLDLGVSSIGSAVIELSDDGMALDIVDAGSRIFEVSEGAESRRIKRTARKNLVRTRKRLELLAKKLCDNGLWVNNTAEGTRKIRAISPYKIRYDALYEKLENPYLLGRAILHMAKHRGAGFVNANENEEEDKFDADGNLKIKKKSAYDLLPQYLVESNSKTIGEFFYKRMQTSKDGDKNLRTVRQKKYALEAKIVDYAIPRYLVKDEFNQIWDKQAQYYPNMQDEKLKQEIYKILFYERAPAPYATADCIYIDGEKRLSKAHPLSEKRRIYEEVNNIRIANDMGKRKLTQEERDKIINEILLQGKNAGKLVIKRILGLNAQQTISLLDDKVIKAYLYAKPEFAEIEYIKNLAPSELEDFIEFLAEPVNPDDKTGRLYNEDELVEQLKNKLKINDEKQIGKLLHKLPKDRGMVGKTASLMLLNKMQEKVMSHREAADELSKADKRFQAEEEIARKNQGQHSQLPYYGMILQKDTQPLPPFVKKYNLTLNDNEKKYGRIANPAVHMILNQIRCVVNDIIRIYGRPYEINLELGRDVGLSAIKKKQLETQQRANEKLNEEAKNYLLEHKLYVNKNNILKYKLAKEQGWKDAYNPSQNIGHCFESYEIEHIIPQAKGGTDTYANLCLVNRTDNAAKGNDFAYDYFAKTKSDEEVREIIKNARLRLGGAKAWRFEPDAREKFEENDDEDATDRYLTDTRYVSKMAQRYLRAILDYQKDEDVAEISTRILAVKGGQTANLRTVWNLDGIEYDLLGLDVPRYIPCQSYWVENETGVVVEQVDKPNIDGNWRFFDKIKNPQWLKKPRIDHRHHAMDAIVVACVNRSFLQQLSKANNRGYALKHSEYPLPLQKVESLGEFRRNVVDLLKDVRVSHKANHSQQGQLHEETGKVKLGINPEDDSAIITVYARKILNVIKSKKDLMKLLISNTIKDEWHPSIALDKQAQMKLKESFETYYDIAEQTLIAKNEQGFRDGKKALNISEMMILNETFKIIQEKKLWKDDKFKCYENSRALIDIKKHGIAYQSGNNHRIDFYEKDGKVGWEVINRFNVNQADFHPKWQENGGKIIWSIQQGDLLEMATPPEWSSYCAKERCLAKVKKFTDGSIAIDFEADARMTSPQNKELKYMLVDTISSKGLSYLNKGNARKVELSAFGKVQRKHRALWYGKKSAA